MMQYLKAIQKKAEKSNNKQLINEKTEGFFLGQRKKK